MLGITPRHIAAGTAVVGDCSGGSSEYGVVFWGGLPALFLGIVSELDVRYGCGV